MGIFDVSKASQGQVFAKRSTQHILILASGDKVRHMNVRPWMAGVAIGFAGLFTIGYLAATSYLVLRDDLIGATMARQARIQHDYEDRISALRSQLDRVTSRQLLDQQVVEQKVEKLLERQMALSLRQGKIGDLLERGEHPAGSVPVPAARPDTTGKQAAAAPQKESLKALEALLANDPQRKDRNTGSTPSVLAAYAPSRESAADRADRVFGTVTRSLKSIEIEQLAHIQGLAKDANGQANAITRILRGTGVSVPETQVAAQDAAMGGPYIAPGSPEAFTVQLGELDSALTRLETVRDTARRLPYGNPAPGRDITSGFGTRLDPFLNRPALHAGIDFRSDVGAPVRSTGEGRVITAGPASGYGNMIEIDHGQGITSRYGHLSRILVSVGDNVSTGQEIGEAGSTGRSTGPHLHYEVRRNGNAIDPMRFVDAGIKLNNYLN